MSENMVYRIAMLAIILFMIVVILGVAFFLEELPRGR